MGSTMKLLAVNIFHQGQGKQIIQIEVQPENETLKIEPVEFNGKQPLDGITSLEVRSRDRWLFAVSTKPIISLDGVVLPNGEDSNVAQLFEYLKADASTKQKLLFTPQEVSGLKIKSDQAKVVLSQAAMQLHNANDPYAEILGELALPSGNFDQIYKFWLEHKWTGEHAYAKGLNKIADEIRQISLMLTAYE